jgi:Flp pilus assembly protein TadD
MTKRTRLWAFAAAAWAVGCAGGAPSRPTPVEVSDPNGFTISAPVRASSAARADFASGLRSLEQKQYDRAIAELTRVTEAAPDAIAAHIDLAIAYRETNDLARAEQSLKQALALNPKHPVALNELGIVYRRTGRLAQARQSYEQVLALYPSFHFARRNLGILCDLYLGDAACALEQYQLYLQAVPGDANVTAWVGDLRARAGR